MIEIAVTVQKRVSMDHAKCSDQAIDGFADRAAAFPQFSEILGGGNGKILATSFK